MRKENISSYHFIQNCTRIIMTDSVALLKRKNMIVKFLIDREFIIFFIQNKAQTHVAQEVLVDGFISGRLVSALTFPGSEESRLPRRVSPRPSVCYGPEPASASPLWRRASRASQVRPRAGPGESSLSAAQSRPPSGRQRRVGPSLQWQR